MSLYLPRNDGDTGQDELQQASFAPGATGETALVVEDDSDVRTYTVTALQELGYRVIESVDGPSAMSVLEKGEVDLVFTDVVLPGGMTGADVVARARELWPSTRTLFTTGYARDVIVRDGRLERGIALLAKPFSFEELAANVREVLDTDA